MVGSGSAKKKTADLELVTEAQKLSVQSPFGQTDSREETENKEAEKFFSAFRKPFSRRETPETVDESDFGEPPCAEPIDIGWSPESDTAEDDFESSAQDDIARRTTEEPLAPAESVPAGTEEAPETAAEVRKAPGIGEEQRRLLVAQIRKENLSLAATLEKAEEWKWAEGRLSLTFGFEYEAALAKNEAATIRKAAAQIGLPSFKMDVITAGGREVGGGEESPRVELVRRVFRGQVMKG